MSGDHLKKGSRVRLSWLGVARCVFCGPSPKPVRGTVTKIEKEPGGVYVRLDGMKRPSYFMADDWEPAPEGAA